MGEVVTESYLQWLKNEFENSSYWQHLGITFERLDQGNVIIRMPVSHELMNSNNVVHGGAVASISDSIIGATIRSTREVKVATVSLTTQFVAPVRDGTLYASAKLINTGRRIQNVESKVTNENGEIVATALGTFAIKSNKNV